MLELFPIRQLLLAGAVAVACLAVQTSVLAATSPVETPRKKSDHHTSTNSVSSNHHASAKATATSATRNGKHTYSKTKSGKKRGQQAIDSQRTRQIQQALIREHYLEGQPSGKWDGATQAAMQRYQADQGWQTKTTPDSRALIRLGLGPSHDHLLNPESAMTTAPLPDNAKGVVKPNSADPVTPRDKAPTADTPQ
jgi:hypothetical protein